MLQTYQAVLRVMEQQQAALGIMTPPHIVAQIVEYRQKIAELEGRLHGLASAQPKGPRHNLPSRDYERYVGRQKELGELDRLLGPRSRTVVVTIDGIGGIGKSALALETAHCFRRSTTLNSPQPSAFEAIVWVSAKQTYLTASGIRERRQVFRTLEDVFAAIARVLDYPAITTPRPEEQRAIVEQVLREQRTLLILDNLETVDDENLLDFLHELPEPTKALVTTRHRIDVARPVRLTGMQHDDALVADQPGSHSQGRDAHGGRAGAALAAHRRRAAGDRLEHRPDGAGRFGRERAAAAGQRSERYRALLLRGERRADSRARSPTGCCWRLLCSRLTQSARSLGVVAGLGDGRVWPRYGPGGTAAALAGE